MLNFPLWKRLVILAICLVGLVVSLPNLFYDRVERHNDAVAALDAGAAEPPELASDKASWPGFLPSGLVNLGLDLRGGAHVLAEVLVTDVHAERLEGLWPTLRDALREERDLVGAVRRVDSPPNELRIRVGNPEAMDQALEAVRAASQPVFSITGIASRDFEASPDGDEIVVTFSEAELEAMDERTMQQSLEIIRRRVDETGTREPTIQRQGADRILIQVPGIGSAEELLAIIGQTARLSFHPVVGRTSDPDEAPGPDNVIYPSMDEEGVLLHPRATRSGNRRAARRQPAFIRPERQAGGQLPL